MFTDAGKPITISSDADCLTFDRGERLRKSATTSDVLIRGTRRGFALGVLRLSVGKRHCSFASIYLEDHSASGASKVIHQQSCSSTTKIDLQRSSESVANLYRYQDKR